MGQTLSKKATLEILNEKLPEIIGNPELMITTLSKNERFLNRLFLGKPVKIKAEFIEEAMRHLCEQTNGKFAEGLWVSYSWCVERRSFRNTAAIVERSAERIRQLEAKTLRQIRECTRTIKDNADNGEKPFAFNERTPLEKLGLSVRAYNALKRAKVECLADFRKHPAPHNIRTFGETSYLEVMKKFDELGQPYEGNIYAEIT